MCRSDPKGVITVKHAVYACLLASLFVGAIAVPACAEEKLVAVIDEMEGKEQSGTGLAAGGHTFRAPGVLPLESTVIYSAKVSGEAMSQLSPGLRLAGARGPLFASQPTEIPELLSATEFGLAFSNKLNLTTGGLTLSGEWTKVDAEFDRGATTDKNIKSLVGKMKQAYGINYQLADGFTLSRNFSRLTNQKPGSKLGEATEHTTTGLKFAPGGGNTSLSFLVDETTTELARADRAGGRRLMDATLNRTFGWGGKDVTLSLSHQALEKWGNSGGKKAEKIPTLALGFTRGENKGDKKKGADVTTSFSIARDNSPKETQRSITLTPTGDSMFKGAQLYLQTREKAGEHGFDTTTLKLRSHDIALPFSTMLKGDLTKMNTDGAAPHQLDALHFSATSKPMDRLSITTDYLDSDDSDKGRGVKSKIAAQYAVSELVSLNLKRDTQKHDGELRKQQTALTLARNPSREGGLGLAASYTTRRQQGKNIDPETALQLTYGHEEGLHATGLYKHRQAGPDEYGAQVAFSIGQIQTTAAYVVNGFDAKRKTQDAGNTFDLHCDWEIKKGLQLTGGLRASSAARVFAGGIGPRMLLKGKLSKNEELVVGYLPEDAGLKGKDFMAFAPGAHDIDKKVKGTTDASYILRYTKIVSQDNLLVAYFRTGSVRMDSGMDKTAGDPFAEKSAWLEYRTTF